MTAPVKEHSDDSKPLTYPPRDVPTVPNPNAKNQSASGYPANWTK